MGNGTYSDATYRSATVTRSLTGVGDFAYSKSATKVHANMDPLRINKKPFGKLESRDNEDHPNSIAIIINFDVTGSNYERAIVAQAKLSKLMDGLSKVVPDPQVAIWANDDFEVSQTRQLGAAMQMADFESDNRVDNHLEGELILVRNGGGNRQESYDLALYGAAYKTVLDCVEKRGKKGYMFIYADEPWPTVCTKESIKAVFGDEVTADIPIETLVEDARKLYNVYVLWPDGGFVNARTQVRELFGKEFVIELQDPDSIVETIVSRVTLDVEKEAQLASAGA